MGDKKPTLFGAAWAVAVVLCASPAGAQDMKDMPGMGGMSNDEAPAPAPAGMNHARQGHGPRADDGGLGAYSMMRDASGTSWQPDSTPMEGFSWSAGDWTGMVHGDASLVYHHQGGPRDGDKIFSESMAMAMAQHAAGPGTLTLRAMLSLGPATGRAGYPLLLQTGRDRRWRYPADRSPASARPLHGAGGRR
jgi:hypothetical protein